MARLQRELAHLDSIDEDGCDRHRKEGWRRGRDIKDDIVDFWHSVDARIDSDDDGYAEGGGLSFLQTCERGSLIVDGNCDGRGGISLTDIRQDLGSYKDLKRFCVSVVRYLGNTPPPELGESAAR